VTGAGKDLLLVIGDGVDAGKLTRKLQKEVGEAEIVELRTLPGRTTNGVSKDAVVTLSPYQRHPTTTTDRSVPGGGRIECLAAASLWQGELQSRQEHYAPCRDTAATATRRPATTAAACTRARWCAATRRTTHR
jgi:hypothetical protein